MELVDCHAHLQDKQFDDVESVVLRAKQNGLSAVVCAGDSLFSSQQAVELAQRFDMVFSAVGVHPENVETEKNFLAELQNMAKGKKVVAIGEIGLDFHWTSDEKARALQKVVFQQQIQLANQLDLPIVVHCRDAMGEAIKILSKTPPKRESIMHCYGGSIESAKQLMQLGFCFSFGGVVTFKNAKNVKEVVEALAMDKILLETDCPYLCPEPYRGQRNEPKNVVYVADEIARIKNMTIEEVAKATTENAKRIFKI